MRITLGMQTDETLLNLNNQQEKITNLSQAISSGKELNSPSDDPCSWSQAMNANQTIREYNSFISNISFASNWGQATESALSQFTDLLSRARSLGEEANSASGQNDASELSMQVDGILQDAVSIANTQYNGRYIFAGTATDTQPYSIDNSTGQVTYSGNADSIKVKTSMSSTGGGMTTVNLTGDGVFGTAGGGSNVINEIWNLEQAIKSGNSNDIANSVSTISDAFNQVNDQFTTIGSMVSSLSTQKSALSTMVTNEKGVLSDLQDTDMASAATKLSQAQTTYQAALQVTSTLDNLNLASILS